MPWQRDATPLLSMQAEVLGGHHDKPLLMQLEVLKVGI